MAPTIHRGILLLVCGVLLAALLMISVWKQAPSWNAFELSWSPFHLTTLVIADILLVAGLCCIGMAIGKDPLPTINTTLQHV